MVPPGEGNEARGDGRRGVGVSHSTAEAGELSPRDPVEGRGHRQVAPVEGKTANPPRLGPVSTSRQRIAELARHALGMAVAIAWLPGPAGTRRRVAKPSVEEPDAAEPARPDLWGARVSNDPGLPDWRRQAERATPVFRSRHRNRPNAQSHLPLTVASDRGLLDLDLRDAGRRSHGTRSHHALATRSARGCRWAYFSQPICGDDRSLCSPEPSPPVPRQRAQSANSLGKWHARQDSNLRPSA